MFICQTALYLIIHLEFYILLPLSYHFCLTNNTNILDQCRKTHCACRCLDRGTLPATAQHVQCLTGGSHPLAPSIPPGIWASWPPCLQQHERARKPTQLCELAEGRGPEAAARHSQSQQSERPALFWRASREWPLLLQRACSRFLLQTGAFCAATRATERWPALSSLSSSLYGLHWWSFHSLLQGEEYDQRRALFNIFVSSLFNSLFGSSLSDHSVTSMEFVGTGSEIMTIIRILSNSKGNIVRPTLCVSCFAFLTKIP